MASRALASRCRPSSHTLPGGHWGAGPCGEGSLAAVDEGQGTIFLSAQLGQESSVRGELSAGHQVGGQTILEYWIPAEDLAALNASIVGTIEVVAAHHLPGAVRGMTRWST
jgi:hypothetical protein